MQKFANINMSGSNVIANVKRIQQTAKGEARSVFDKDSWWSSLKDFLGKEKQVLYMTPYSNAVLSHPIVVGVVGLIGVTLLLLSVASLFVHVDKLSCFIYATKETNYKDI